MVNYKELAKKFEYFELRGYSQLDYPSNESLGFSRGKYCHAKHGGLKRNITFQLSSMNEEELRADIISYYKSPELTNFTLNTVNGVSFAELLA